jgi:two-component system, sensor histidine kinase PdtaS
MFFEKIINLGVKSEMEFYQKREVKLVNLFAIITLSALLVGSSSLLFISGEYPAPVMLFTAVSSSCLLFFNAKGYHNLATYFFVIPINIIIFVLCEQYEEAAGNYLYYFLFIFCLAVLHNPVQSNVRTIIFLSVFLISFFAAKVLDVQSLRLSQITPSDIEILFSYNQLIAVSLSLVLVYLVVRLINKQNFETFELLEKEKASQVKISNSLKEKEVLLSELQHRVKNNLAIISSLLNLQMDKAPCDRSKQLMLESKNRVVSMAMVHNNLYKKENLYKIDLKLYLSELVNELVNSFPIRTNQIQVQGELDWVEMEITDAVPIGLIVNETLTNSLKHAFNDFTQTPIIKLKLQLVQDNIRICVADNGIGFSESAIKKQDGLGLSLIESLADQIDAEVSFLNNNGACVSLNIPIRK